MKNKISDLRNHMFAALERLGDSDLDGEALKLEIDRAHAISQVGKVVVESAKTELLYAKLTRNNSALPDKYLEEPETPAIERPPADYSNKKHGE